MPTNSDTNTTDQVKSYEVVYSVKFKCVVDVEPGENLQDKVCDISIPEGGRNYSKYILNTFEEDSSVEIVDDKSPETMADKEGT